MIFHDNLAEAEAIIRRTANSSIDLINTIISKIDALGLFLFTVNTYSSPEIGNFCQMLIDHGAQVNVTSRSTADRQPLEIALDYGNSACVAVLIRNGANVNPCFEYAIRHNEPDWLEQLRENGVDLSSVVFEDNTKPLMLAVSMDKLDIVSELLKFDVRLSDSEWEAVFKCAKRLRTRKRVSDMMKLLATYKRTK